MSTRRKITKEIRDAITRAVESEGSQEAFAQKSGLLQKSVSTYISGQVVTMNERTYRDLLPHIEPFLPTPMNKASTQQQKSEPDKPLKPLTDVMTQLVPNAQHVIAGVINVHGVPNDKITMAIKQSSLTEDQKKELILRIFS